LGWLPDRVICPTGKGDIMEWLLEPQAWVSLVTLTALEIVLGIDNIIFISVLVSRLPAHQRQRARILGLSLAMVSRIILLLSLVWVMGLTKPLLTILSQDISGRDIILLAGGLFLLAKSTMEIHHALEGAENGTHAPAAAGFTAVLVQIAIIDIVFSLDSVITAVGLAKHVPVMILAIMIAIGVMMIAAKPISDFVDAHPTVKLLALSFLVLIGVALVAEGLDFHIPKGYIYFAMAYAFVVEMLNLRIRKARAPLILHKHVEIDERENA
jgi:predicted tellurium resistance membrane protein TerC